MANVAFIGLGVMGYPMAGHLQTKGGHSVRVYNRTAAKAQSWVDIYGGASAPTPAEAARDADFVFTCVGNDDDLRQVTTGPDGVLSAMKPGAILINIGRGGLVDEDALKVGLQTDQPAHAVLDVFQTEPLPADYWIWSHPKVRVTAHTSNSGHGTAARGDDLFVANLERFLNGQPLINEASPREVGL